MVPEKQSVALGTETAFRVKATGDGLHFQWKNHIGDLRDDSRYYGTETDTLHIVKVEKCDQLPGYFQCLVKNDIKETLSNKAILTVGKLHGLCYILFYVSIVYSSPAYGVNYNEHRFKAQVNI